MKPIGWVLTVTFRPRPRVEILRELVARVEDVAPADVFTTVSAGRVQKMVVAVLTKREADAVHGMLIASAIAFEYTVVVELEPVAGRS